MLPDLINSLFELIGAGFICLSIIKLHKDKQVKGVSWIHIAFFTSWGYWNMYYYPHLNQWLSFYGGLTIIMANSFWTCQILFYSWRNRV